MEGAIKGVALNHAFDTRPIHPPAKCQDIARLRSNHQMLVVDRAFDAARLVRSLEVAANHTSLLLQFKKLRRGAPVWIFAIQSPLTRDVSRLLFSRRLLPNGKAASEDHQSKAKHQTPQATSLHHVLLAMQRHSKIYSNSRILSSFLSAKTSGKIKSSSDLKAESQSRIRVLQP
jgi:hypothetical protein